MYTPHRDYRFEYIEEAINFVENSQCKDCALKITGEYPMCDTVAVLFLLEQPLDMIDDRGDAGIFCTRFVGDDD